MAGLAVVVTDMFAAGSRMLAVGAVWKAAKGEATRSSKTAHSGTEMTAVVVREWLGGPVKLEIRRD